MPKRCSIPGCKAEEVAIGYLGRWLCDRCWNRFAEKPVWKLRKALGVAI